MLIADSEFLDWLQNRGRGTLTALVFILLLLIFLTGASRRKIRWAVMFLVLHVLLVVLLGQFGEDVPMSSTVEFVSFFLLYSSVGLSSFLLVTSSRLSQAFIKPLPKIFLDIAHSVVYVIAFLSSLAAVGVQPVELFAGSALLTAIIGLSLRDTLGNLFAGLAIQVQRPFEVGDWIQFNQDVHQVGQVAEINWRATRVVTPDKVEIVVPNALLAAAPIINYSRPDAPVRRIVRFHTHNGARPHHVKEIVLAALADAPGVQTNPAPTIYTTGFDDRGMQFTVKFYIANFVDRAKAESVVRDRIWYALKRHGLDIPVPPRAVRVHKVGKRALARRKKDRIARRVKALGCVDFFSQLSPEARHRLACRAKTRLYAAKEVIIRQNDNGDELFILELGEAAVKVARPEGDTIEVARLVPGNFFGEMAALTGEPRRATIQALKECEVLVIGKAALAEVFASSPDVAEHVSQTIAQRQADLSARMSEHGPTPPHAVAEHSHKLLQRIKQFFSM